MAERERVVVAHDPVNEQALLGAMLADAAVRRKAVRQLSPDLFLVRQHQAIMRALTECENRHLEPTAQALAAHGSADDWGGADYVALLLTSASPRSNLRRHREALEWDAARHRVLTGSHRALTEALCDARAAPDRVQAAAQSVLRGLEGWSGRRHLRDPGQLAKSWKAEFAIRRAGGGFVPTGYDAMDANLTEGFAPGRVTVVVGLSGIGKSTLAANLALRLAERGIRVLYGAWEMGSTSVLDVMVSIRTGVALGLVMRPASLGEEEVAELAAAADWVAAKIRFMDNPFYAKRGDDSPRERASNDRNLDVLEGYLAESGCEVVVCDLWERMLVMRDPERDVAPALYRFHAICEEYAVHGVVLQQLRLKDVERRPDRRPTREAIKGTSAYVDVADLILGVHHEVPADGKLEAICLKQRKGRECWSVQFEYDPERARIEGGVEVPYDPAPRGMGAMPEDSFRGGPPRRRKQAADDSVM